MGRSNHQEIEVKFLIKEPARFEETLTRKGGKLVQSKVYEINFHFDSEDHRLQTQNKILRLRKDISSMLTYKGPTEIDDGIQIREELEIPIEDIQLTTKILESIGFQIVHIYEKFRTIYAFKDFLVMIDELPIGIFLEIEGKNPILIKMFVDSIGIEWNRNIPFGYFAIFQKLCNLKGRQVGNMEFDDKFSSESDLEIIGILPADIH
ncbi:class IV adenylate cyclase [Chloroflexota bacterium]